jgi:hypothetical protein
MKRELHVGDFHICPLECGGTSSLEAFARAAKDSGAVSLTVEIPSGCKPDREMLAVREAYADSVEVLFSSMVDFSAPEALSFVPDICVAALKTLCVNGKCYLLENNRKALTSLLAAFDGSVSSMLREICRAFHPIHGERYDAVILPDFDGWRAELDTLWNADERLVRQYLLELVDCWIDADAVFAVRMIPTPFCDGVMVSPSPSAMALRRIGERRGRVTLTSGARSVAELYQNFDLAAVQLIACGIPNWHLPTKNGWEVFSLRYSYKKI